MLRVSMLCFIDMAAFAQILRKIIFSIRWKSTIAVFEERA